MKTKNIILFSIATTLLFANCVEGMKKKEHKENPITFFFPAPKNTKTNLINDFTKLDKEQSCYVSIFFNETEPISGVLIEGLFAKIIKNKHRLTMLVVKNNKFMKDVQTLDWKSISGHLSMLELPYGDLQAEIVELIIKNNPELIYLDLSYNDKINWEHINWSYAKKLRQLRLCGTSITIKTVKTILENCPNFILIKLSECENIDTQSKEFEDLQNEYSKRVVFEFSKSNSAFLLKQMKKK